jgi:hypothetical protein
MNAVYRILAFVGIAAVAAVASFEDRVALAIGRIGLLALLGMLVFVIAGAALSIWRRNDGKNDTQPGESRSREGANGDPSRPIS